MPVLFYMPETKWGGGAGGLITYRSSLDQTEKRPSSIYFYAIYTQLKQSSSQIKPELYFREESYLLNATIMAETFPDKFWGIGPHADNEAEEDYTPRTYSLEFTFQKKYGQNKIFMLDFMACMKIIVSLNMKPGNY